MSLNTPQTQLNCVCVCICRRPISDSGQSKIRLVDIKILVWTSSILERVQHFHENSVHSFHRYEFEIFVSELWKDKVVSSYVIVNT